MTDGLNEILTRLGPLDYLLIVVGLLLIVYARVLITRFSANGTVSRAIRFRSNALRGFAALMIGVVGYYHFYRADQDLNSLAVRLISILFVIYLALLAAFLFDEFVRRRFGRRYSVGDKVRIADTYASRALSLLINVLIFVVVLISIIRLAGFESLLEAGGVLGFIGVLLALTQGAWAPDIISGLIILNSNMFQERDVVKLWDNHDSLIGTVYRTRAFHTELLSQVDNHRIMIRNSRMRDYTVHNLSRFASARGVRESQSYKIGYDVSPELVKAFFERVYQRAIADDSVKLESQYPLEVRVVDTGDHAVEWSVHYYTKDVASIVGTGHRFREIVLNLALEEGLSLATPVTHRSVVT